MVSVPKRTQEKLPEGEPEQIRKNGIIFNWTSWASPERLIYVQYTSCIQGVLIHTSSVIYSLFNPKVHGRVFNSLSASVTLIQKTVNWLLLYGENTGTSRFKIFFYQFISKFDTFRYKFHCHIRQTRSNTVPYVSHAQ